MTTVSYIMEVLSQTIKCAETETGLNISVICDQTKAFYAQHPKQVQRLPTGTGFSRITGIMQRNLF